MDSKIDQNKMVKVGKIKDAHSLKGALYLIIFSKDQSWQSELTECYLADEEKLDFKLYNIEKISPHKEGFLLVLENVKDRNAAEALIGKMFFVTEDTFESEEDETIFLREILNFEVINQENQKIGFIKDFSSNGAQDLLIIQTESKQFMMPFVAPLIQEIDYENAKIYLTIPEGLQDIDD